MSTPSTAAGQALHYKLHGTAHDHIPNADCYLNDDIVAIENQAAAHEKANRHEAVRRKKITHDTLTALRQAEAAPAAEKEKP